MHRASKTPVRRVGWLGAILAMIVAIIPAALWAASPAGAVAGAAFTTTSDGSKVNANHYADKCDVYINGGPNNGANTLTDGYYFFAVLSPGGQSDPNDGTPNNLSDDEDTRSNRVVQVSDGKIVGTTGGHVIGDDPSTTTISDDQLVQLCDYADTTNNGGVYILALCLIDSAGDTAAVDPSDCKYDAFKVTASGGEPNSDLIALKDATPSFTRTFTWDIEKSVDKTSVSASGGSATFNYTVVATKSSAVDSGYTVSGEISVFNPNAGTVTGVAVTDAIGLTNCTVTGGSTSIAGGDSASFDYTCALAAADATSGTNMASVTWDQASIDSPGNSTTASANFNFANATPTVVGNSADVTDNFNLAGPVALTPSPITASHTYNYSRTIAIPATGCLSYTNTAVVTFQGGSDSDSETVTVCKLNSNGFTIGFWSNKNGQKLISDNKVAICTALSAYTNVLGTITNCASGSVLTNYVTNVIKAAEASGDGAPMFKAQFLATALNVWRTPSLGTTTIQLTSSEASLLGGSSCQTVSAILAAANAAYPTLSNAALTSKADFMSIKSLFDRINNNLQLTC
jgi:hypothetical protein